MFLLLEYDSLLRYVLDRQSTVLQTAIATVCLYEQALPTNTFIPGVFIAELLTFEG